jgi:hypothetical protein
VERGPAPHRQLKCKAAVWPLCFAENLVTLCFDHAVSLDKIGIFHKVMLDWLA